MFCVPLQTGDESHPSAAVEDILVAPDKLRDLDLDAFAEELETSETACKHTVRVKKTSHKRTVQRAPVLIKQGENVAVSATRAGKIMWRFC